MSKILDHNGLYRADCLKLLERLPDESINLIYVDPPWIEPEFKPTVTDSEYQQFMMRVLRQYWRVLHPDGTLLMHTKQGLDNALHDLLNATFGRYNAREEIILPTCLPPSEGRRYEYIRRYAKSEENHADLPDSIWDFPAYDLKRSEEMRFIVRPKDLVKSLIENTTAEGDVVLDTFSGTGTTLVGAAQLNRRWIGCDKEDAAVQSTIERFETELPDILGSFIVGDVNALDKFEIFRSSVYPTFFISYKREDAEQYVNPLCKKLSDDYIYFWRDTENIPGGADWERKLNEALETCEALILFVTRASLESQWVRREYTAFLERGRTIYPIMCEDGVSLPEELEQYQHIPYRSEQRILQELRTFPLHKANNV